MTLNWRSVRYTSTHRIQVQGFLPITGEKVVFRREWPIIFKETLEAFWTSYLISFFCNLVSVFVVKFPFMVISRSSRSFEFQGPHVWLQKADTIRFRPLHEFHPPLKTKTCPVFGQVYHQKIQIMRMISHRFHTWLVWTDDLDHDKISSILYALTINILWLWHMACIDSKPTFIK